MPGRIYHLYNISKIRKFLSPECTQTCSSLLYGLPAYLFNAAAGSICNVERSDHITPSLFNLHWLSIKHRIQFKILLLCYKALNGQARDYISELLKQKIPSRYSLKGHCHDKAHYAVDLIDVILTRAPHLPLVSLELHEPFEHLFIRRLLAFCL